MVTDKSFDLNSYPLKGAVNNLNEELAALGITPSQSGEDQAMLYGLGVYGVRFSGNTRLGALIDAVARTMWPDDAPAVDPHTANSRDHLLVCANYPGERTEALHFFTTFKPGQSPWINDEEGELKRVAIEAVNIDSSAKLKEDDDLDAPEEMKKIPPFYSPPVSAYLMNLYWLVAMEDNSLAVIEVNEAMKGSLTRWGIDLGSIDGAEPRKIGNVEYERLTIDPSSPRNQLVVDSVKSCPPATFRLSESGLAVPDSNTSSIVAA